MCEKVFEVVCEVWKGVFLHSDQGGVLRSVRVVSERWNGVLQSIRGVCVRWKGV